MVEESLRDVMTSARQRLHEQLDVHFEAMTSAHEQAVAAARSEAEVAAEQRWAALLAEARTRTQQDVEAAVAAARVELDTERSDAARRRTGLVEVTRTIDRTPSLTETLDAILRAASAYASRVDLFVVQAAELRQWTKGSPAADSLASIARDALHRRTMITREGKVAVPLLLDGIPVAVLCADGSTASQSDIDGDALELIARIGASRLAYLTAARLNQARNWMRVPSPATPTGTASTASEEEASPIEDEVGARRFARLLISEIRMYNDSAVRAGRERRDLLHRLRPEIERVRRLYEARVAGSLPLRDRYFDEELVRTLADGDRALLG